MGQPLGGELAAFRSSARDGPRCEGDVLIVAGQGIRLRQACERSGRAAGPLVSPGSTGSQRVAGATAACGANLRGPVRDARKAAPWILRQLPAACSRSAGVSENCTSFSASAKVAAETGGPKSGAVPKAGGAPAGGVPESATGLRQAVAAVRNAAEARLRN